MRQHPSRVTAAVVLLLSTVVGLTIGTVLLNQSNRLLERTNRLLDEQRQVAEKNYKEAEQQRQNADAMFHEAKNTVDTYLTRVSEAKWMKEPRLQP